MNKTTAMHRAICANEHVDFDELILAIEGQIKEAASFGKFEITIIQPNLKIYEVIRLEFSSAENGRCFDMDVSNRKKKGELIIKWRHDIYDVGNYDE